MWGQPALRPGYKPVQSLRQLRPALPSLSLRRTRRPTPPVASAGKSTGVSTAYEDEPEWQRPQQPQRVSTAQPAAAAAAAPAQHQRWGVLGGALLAVRQHLLKLDGLWGKFVPMAGLFFLMAFVNTISDSLKDSLVITAVGGGTHVIPYLTVYGVLPSSLIFLVLYAWGTQRFSRERLFNIILGFFITFYAGFGLLYPSHEALHLNGMGDALVQVLPTGLSGMVGMVRNWLFTLFYCASELWGDVMLSLLFWGLANETTSIEDAPLLYPLFGIGANVAQTMAGRVLRILSQTAGGCKDAYTTRVQIIMGLCVTLGLGIMALHRYISKRFPKNPKGSTVQRVAAERAQQAKQQRAGQPAQQQRGSSDSGGSRGAIADDGSGGNGVLGLAAGLKGRVIRGLGALARNSGGDVHFAGTGSGKAGIVSLTAKAPSPAALSLNSSSGAAVSIAIATTSSSSRSGGGSLGNGTVAGQPLNEAGQPLSEEDEAVRQAVLAAERREARRQRRKKAMSLKDAFSFLKRSPQIRCLAVMALSQGITCNLLDLTFKHHLHKLHTSPAAYSAFLGDTAMWTGIVTGSLMFSSPLLFEKLGWKGVASATPNFMMWAGVPFFAGCILYNLVSGSLATAGLVTLKALVITGAVLQVVARGAKFSLFKPAEEMVYIGLDDESRTKGKAAIDVVGAQSGKSAGSMLQQALLILSGGTLGGILPILTVLYLIMLTQWKRAVGELGDQHDPAHAHRMSVLGSLDSESDSEHEGEGHPRRPRQQAQQAQQHGTAPSSGPEGEAALGSGVAAVPVPAVVREVVVGAAAAAAAAANGHHANGASAAGLTGLNGMVNGVTGHGVALNGTAVAAAEAAGLAAAAAAAVAAAAAPAESSAA
uniref:ADP,ATP carrier protein n=1 Tax=Parachlorella kessleri TaxID=3074 RepID=A0A387L062_PARKE|nr:hypothetical protein [Parachlorella kessleri]